MEQNCQGCNVIYNSEGHPGGTWLTFCRKCNVKYTPGELTKLEEKYEIAKALSEQWRVMDHEKFVVAENMQNYGGGFVQSLGIALMKADQFNAQKIKDAFPEYWEKYKKLGEKNGD